MALEDICELQCTNLQDFPIDVIASTVLRLPLHDVIIFSRTCKHLNHCIASDDRVWQPLCLRQYGNLTCVLKWLPDPRPLSSSSPGTSQAGGTAAVARSYRKLYQTLHSFQRLVGLWRRVDESALGTLHLFKWGTDCFELCRLQENHEGSGIEALPPRFQLGPRYEPAPVALSLLDSGHCMLRFNWGRAKSGRPVDAVSVVAAAGMHAFSRGEAVLGSSPPNSFGYEMMQFMAASVSPGSSGKRNKKGSRSLAGSGGACGGGGAEELFARITVPLSTRQHPLAGVWQGVHGVHGVQVISISYDFSGSSARIIATALAGQNAGHSQRRVWEVAAAPLPAPWPEADVALIELRSHNLSAAVGDLEGRGDAEVAALSPVVAVHHGQGVAEQVGARPPRWQPGRLWVYESGTIGFVWVEQAGDGPSILVDYVRLEPELLPPPPC